MSQTMNNIPCPGFGTFKIPAGELCVNAVREAVASGYTHIDTASIYGNECSVGEGIRQSGRKREELFVTSKVWNTDRGYDRTLRACEKSLKDLGLDYLDLYLIHWPANEMQFGSKASAINTDTWKAMERLSEEGLVRLIGLSNFYPQHIAPILADASISPAVDQIEYHPGLLQQDTVEFCCKNGILVEAWAPLGRGSLLEDTTLSAIAKAHGKTVSQVILRWCVQNGILPLVKSVHTDRMRENLDFFDFELTQEEMAAVSGLPALRIGSHPDTAAF